jgi:hypothetical protein
MKKLILMLICTFYVLASYSQKSEVVIKVKDTVSVGTPFKLEIELKNVSGSFKTPVFQGLRLVGGPNTSSSFSMVNGETSSKAVYTYYLMAEESGSFIIQLHDMESSKEMLTFDEIQITAVDTFSGDSQLIKYYESGSSSEQKMQSSKRKIRKI